MSVAVLGCGRSGTSIVGELFKMSRLKYFFEPPMDTVRELGGRKIAVKNPTDPLRRTRGLQCDIEELDEILSPRYIWVIRNPLDTVASLEPIVRENRLGFWSEHDTYRSKLEWYELAAVHWNMVNAIGYSSVPSPLVVRYEDLILQTKPTVNKILQWCGLKDGRWTRRYIKKVTNVSGRNEVQEQLRWHKRHSRHVGRWQESLSEEQAVRVLQLTVPSIGLWL